MNLKERAYSVLVVSASDKFNEAMTALLPEFACCPVRFASDISAAKRAVAERSFDYVIVNSPLPDDLLLVKSQIHGEIYDKVSEHGVFTLPKPISKPVITTALGWMASARECLRKFEKKNLSIEEKMEEIRIVNRAKWLLVSELKMDEPDAHRYIEKQAMDRCVPKRQVAEEILKTYG